MLRFWMIAKNMFLLPKWITEANRVTIKVTQTTLKNLMHQVMYRQMMKPQMKTNQETTHKTIFRHLRMALIQTNMAVKSKTLKNQSKMLKNQSMKMTLKVYQNLTTPLSKPKRHQHSYLM